LHIFHSIGKFSQILTIEIKVYSLQINKNLFELSKSHIWAKLVKNRIRPRVSNLKKKH